MEALINGAEKIKSKFKFGSLVTLFKQKIEDAIINDKSIIVSASNSFIEIRNTILIEDYECDIERFYLNDGNFELHIKMEEIQEVKYDDTYDECFTFLHSDNMKIQLCFL